MDEKVKKIKVAFWGTPDFALPTFKKLLADGFHVSGVVTNPDEPKGRKQIITPPPVKVFAQKHNIPVFQPDKLELEALGPEIKNADLFVIAAYGKIIPQAIIDIPRFGSLNVHPSLLPHWRGASPIQYAILNGDAETGISVMKIDELLDHGPVVAQRSAKIAKRETYTTLHDKLSREGADLLTEILPKYLSGEILTQPQDESKATYSKLLKKDDGRVVWTRPAEEIERMVRAFTPWPGAWTLWPTQDKILRLKIEEADWINEEPPQGSPGFTWASKDHEFLVRTGRGSLIVKKAILEGKGSLNPTELLHGYPDILGTAFI